MSDSDSLDDLTFAAKCYDIEVRLIEQGKPAWHKAVERVDSAA